MTTTWPEQFEGLTIHGEPAADPFAECLAFGVLLDLVMSRFTYGATTPFRLCGFNLPGDDACDCPTRCVAFDTYETMRPS